MEILSPAGNFEKLKFAVMYGANAVYAAGKMFGLRAKSANFSHEELVEAVSFCHENSAKIYITVNIFAHNSDIDKISNYLQFLQKIGVDALIISDPAIFNLAKQFAPKIPIHISTQANVVSWKSAEFWQKLGAERIILARELSINEIREIKEKVQGIELEMFVHGAMCMSYSGRCLLSSFLNKRDANKGECTQPCRWEYKLTEKTRPNEQFPIEEDHYGTYILNSKDLSLFDKIQQIIAAGIDSIKIEGRMKSLYYVANVTRVYKQAINDLTAHNSVLLKNELNKISHREYSEGFFENFNSDDMQNHESSAYIREYQFLGEVVDIDGNFATIKVRSKFAVGENIELIFPNLEDDFKIKVTQINDENNEPILFTKPNTKIKLFVGKSIPHNGILRKKK
ncbi:MAG: U32 family peptidase [Candidatus Cloacimonetes bacterium]|jgi:U32 family peptidase|nr:U32 family peptidase [Candidatus Cloacimonadota bacterium]MBT6994729.1 U32 family peptidase [Candidatus Cloacimonadota bacterium]MBT7469610.1 U32 family peptidase [Candidatus Cloacimonadota bacterium]